MLYIPTVLSLIVAGRDTAVLSTDDDEDDDFDDTDDDSASVREDNVDPFCIRTGACIWTCVGVDVCAGVESFMYC